MSGPDVQVDVHVGVPDEADTLARLELARLVEPGSWPVHQAVERHGAAAVRDRLRAGDPLPGISPALAEGARGRASAYGASGAIAERDRLDAVGGRLIVPGDAEWPTARLSWGPVCPQLAAPPLLLQVRGAGRLDETVERSVAIVGARAATGYGTYVTGTLSLQLADRGWTVLSGGAYGIDAAAHRAALDSGRAATVAVLACGVDVAYPRGNDRLLARIAEQGLIVSEHAPGASPTRVRFLVRNRLIAALGRGVVVVEAAARSGSLSTANRAADLDRHVMAVPGPVTSAQSTGCHVLIRGGAHLVSDAGEVIALVGAPGEGAMTEPRGEARVHDDLPIAVRSVLEAVPVRGGAGEATIARAAGVPVLLVQQSLPVLLVHGLVQRCDTGWRLTPLGAGRPAASPGRQ